MEVYGLFSFVSRISNGFDRLIIAKVEESLPWLFTVK